MSQPNILLFIPDGLQGRVLHEGLCHTPAIDRLAARGVRITNAYTPCPVCSPARASMMTGLLPHNHGVLQVEHILDPDQGNLREDKPHWAQRLRDDGYQTAYFGKWHIERSRDLEKYGWSINHSAGGLRHRKESEKGIRSETPLDPELTCYLQGPDGYNDTLYYGVTDMPLAERVAERDFAPATDAAVEFLKNAADNQPWACTVSYFGPNEAMIVGRDAFEMVDPATIALPRTLHDEHADRPNIYKRVRQIFDGLSDEQWRLARACYFARISELDHEVGRVLDALEQSGKMEDTIVVLAADHGRYVGDHGFEAHNFGAFEEIYNVPMVIAGPGVATGATSSARVGLHDLCPTILELTGSQSIDSADSQSFARLLKEPGLHAHDYQTGYAEYHGSRFPLAQRILWDGPWKFVFNGFDFDELYNLDADPDEMTNLIHEPEHEERVKTMMSQVWHKIDTTGDNALLNSHYYSMRLAVVGPEWRAAGPPPLS